MVESIDSTEKYRFSRKTNSAIGFSAPENPHIRGLVKNRKRFEKSTRSDQFGAVESIDSTTDIDFHEKRIAPFDSAPPKTPISEVWSKIDKDSKSRPEAINLRQSKRPIRPWISIFMKNQYRHWSQRPRKPPYPRFRQKSTKIRKVEQKRSKNR